jgi:hypothetical protein
MGFTTVTFCQTCGVVAPEVGDFGFAGLPSRDTRKRRGDMQSFGFIHAGLSAIGAVTEEIEAFKTFLDEHGRHRIGQSSDGEEADDDDVAPTTLREFRFKRRGFEPAWYELHCIGCDETYRSGTSALLPRFKRFALTPARIARFSSNAAAVDDENFYKVGGFPFDDLGALDEFLARHRKHRIEVRRQPAEPRQCSSKRAAPAPSADEWEWLVNVEDRAAVPRIRKILLAGGANCVQAAQALGEIGGKAATAALVEALKHPSPAVRAESVRMLGQKLKAVALADRLIPLLSDPEEQVRFEVVWAFYWMNAKSAVPALAGIVLNRSTPESMRSRIVGALPHIGGSEAIETLIQCLRDESKQIRLDAATALAEKRNVAALKAVVAAAEAGDALFALRLWPFLLEHGGPQTEKVLLGVLRSDNLNAEDAERVRKLATLLIERGTQQRGTADLRHEARRWLKAHPA